MNDIVHHEKGPLESYQKHPLIHGIKTRIKFCKTMLTNAWVPVMSEEAFRQRLTVEEVQDFTQMLVMHQLHLQASPRKTWRLEFIRVSWEWIYKKTLEKPKEIWTGQLSKRVFPEDMAQFERDVQQWLSFYHRMLQWITGLHPSNQSMVQNPRKELEFVYDSLEGEKIVDSLTPQTLLCSLVQLAVLKSLWKTWLGKIPQDDMEVQFTLSEVTRKMTLMQTFPPESWFHSLSWEKKHIIATSENFWIGFDGNDLEALWYSNIIEKFESDALRYLVSILKPEDTSRRNICPRIASYLSRNPHTIVITRDMLETEYWDAYVAQIERRDTVGA